MTITTKKSAYLINTSVYQENSRSDQETKMQVFEQQPFTSQAQFVPHMHMPYIEGPKMDWTVNDCLYHRFFKWETEVWEYVRLWACNASWVKEVQESCSMKWWLWYGSVCFMLHVSQWT